VSERIIDRLLRDVAPPPPAEVIFESGRISWTDDHLLVDHDAAGTMRVAPNGPPTSIRVSRSSVKTRRLFRTVERHRLHVEIRSPGQPMLTVWAETPQERLEGLPEQETRGAELALDDVLTVLDAARTHGATVAHMGAVADERPTVRDAQHGVRSGNSGEDTPAWGALDEDSDGRSTPDVESDDDAWWDVLRTLVLDHAPVLVVAAIAIVTITLSVASRSCGPQHGEPLGEVPDCDEARAEARRGILVVERSGGTSIVFADTGSVVFEVRHGDSGARTAQKHCLRVRRFSAADGRQLAERIVDASEDSDVRGALIPNPGDRLWLYRDDELELLDADTLETRTTLTELAREVPDLTVDPEEALEQRRVALYVDGRLGIQSDTGDWWAVAPDGSSGVVISPPAIPARAYGRELPPRECRVRLTWGVNVFTDGQHRWTLEPENGTNRQKRVLHLADGTRVWDEALLQASVLDTQGNSVCGDFGLPDSVLVQHYAMIGRAAEDRLLSLVDLSGKILWTTGLPGESEVIPLTVAGEIIIVYSPPGGHAQVGHELVGLDLSSGEIRYRVEL